MDAARRSRCRGMVLSLCAMVAVQVHAGTDERGLAFANGMRAYDAANYARAAQLFDDLLSRDPECARCAHMLGRSYGHLAEKASWINALALARKTRMALEQAVALDPEDVPATEDLIRYYRTAPEFLGGSAAKARSLERHLKQAAEARTS